MRLKGKRRQPVATDGTSDEYVQQLVNTGIVKDILSKLREYLIVRASKECTSAPGGVMSTSIDLGYGGVVCRKLRKIGGDSEVSCGTLVGYSENDYSLYEDKQNSLGHSLSS